MLLTSLIIDMQTCVHPGWLWWCPPTSDEQLGFLAVISQNFSQCWNQVDPSCSNFYPHATAYLKVAKVCLRVTIPVLWNHCQKSQLLLASCLETKLKHKKWALSNSTSQASKMIPATKNKNNFWNPTWKTCRLGTPSLNTV